MLLDVLGQDVILLPRPPPPLQPYLLAARRPPHTERSGEGGRSRGRRRSRAGGWPPREVRLLGADFGGEGDGRSTSLLGFCQKKSVGWELGILGVVNILGSVSWGHVTIKAWARLSCSQTHGAARDTPLVKAVWALPFLRAPARPPRAKTFALLCFFLRTHYYVEDDDLFPSICKLQSGILRERNWVLRVTVA